MTISAYRSITIYPAFAAVGACIMPQQLCWPMAEPGESLDYTLNMTPALEDVADSIASATIATAPSGAGEMSVAALVRDDSVLTATLASGMPGRTYQARFHIVTTAGRIFAPTISILVNPASGAWPLPPALSPDFGLAVTAVSV